ncbi:MAG: hypothetical protein KGH84_10520 [Paracoccaceae bacterium]|nr:hypothetical protein [Paracoccaceae bacterium]
MAIGNVSGRRGIPSKRLYLVDPAACPKGLIGGKIRDRLIATNRLDILRSGEYRWPKRR